MPPPTPDVERYVLHLNHALAMESALIGYLEKRATTVTQPELQQHFRAHRDEGIQHRDIVRGIVVALHAEPTLAIANLQPPITPSLFGKMLSTLETEKEDRLLNDSLTDYSLEHYEEALYGALMLIARNLGFHDHAAQFETIRRQEREMADFIAAHQPSVVREAFPPKFRAA